MAKLLKSKAQIKLEEAIERLKQEGIYDSKKSGGGRKTNGPKKPTGPKAKR